MAKVTAAGLVPLHTKMARLILEWSAADLAEHCSVGVATVRNFESGQRVREDSRQAMITAIDKARVVDDGVTYRVELQNGGKHGARRVKA